MDVGVPEKRLPELFEGGTATELVWPALAGEGLATCPNVGVVSTTGRRQGKHKNARYKG
jgi:hypothetical protein